MKKPSGLDPLDAFRLKKAETDQERLEVMEDAIAKAVEKARINYLLVTLSVAVTLILVGHYLAVMEIYTVPTIVYEWCILVMTVLMLLPWQLRKIRLLA